VIIAPRTGPSSTTTPVSRLGRALDLLALLLVLLGAGGYLVSYLGLTRLRAAPPLEFTPGMAIQQLAEYHRLVLISRVALAAIISGVSCGVYAWFHERRARSR